MSFNWKRLINQINTNSVVPVIGNDLSIIYIPKEEFEQVPHQGDLAQLDESDGKIAINLYPWLSNHLYQFFGLQKDIDRFRLSHVVLQLLKERISENEINQTIIAKVNELSDDQIRLSPFRKLAQIPGIDTYITVNLDNFLERAFMVEQLEANPSINFSIPMPAMDSSKIISGTNPIIYNIFGSITGSNFAVSEEEYIEYLYLIRENNADIFEQFYESIKNKNLLMIGCSFPNWLMRFFIRIITGQRLKNNYVGKTVACDKISQDVELYNFLNDHHINVIHIDPSANPDNSDATKFKNTVAFINKLYTEWDSTNDKARNEVKFEEKLFISYASNDRPFVRLIKDEFEKQGVEVFFDDDDLRAGDRYNQKIKKYITNCNYFLPIISKHSLNKERYVYDKEWRRAFFLDEDNSDSFLRPFIIDPEISKSDTRIPNEIRQVHIEKITDQQEITNKVRSFVQDNSLTLLHK